MTTVASPYKYAPANARTHAWEQARYYRVVVKGRLLDSVLRDVHSTAHERAAALLEFRNALDEQAAVLHRKERA